MRLLAESTSFKNDLFVSPFYGIAKKSCRAYFSEKGAKKFKVKINGLWAMGLLNWHATGKQSNGCE